MGRKFLSLPLLRESEDRYRSLFESSTDGILLTTPDGSILDANPAACRMWGGTQEEMCTVGRDGVIDPTDPKLHAVLEERTRTGGFAGELTLKRKDGTRFPAEVTTSTFKDQYGRERTCVIARDIADRKHADELKSDLAAIVDSSDDAIIGKTLDGVITSWNRGAENLYGYSAAEAKSESVSILIPPDRPDELEQILERVKRGERVQHYETNRIRKDGKIIEVSLAVSPILDSTRAIVGVSTIARDITERRHLEGKLLESERLYRTLADSTPDIIFIVRRDTSVQYMNRSGLEHFGLAPEKVVGKKASDLFPPRMAKSLAGPVSTVFQTGKPIHAENELSFRGAVSWRDEDWIPLKTGSETTAVLGISRDITERKRAEDMLKESEDRFREAMEATNDGLWDWNVVTDEIYFSPAYNRMLGYEPGKLSEHIQSWKDLVHPDDLDRVVGLNEDCIENRIPRFETEFRMRTKSGEWKWVLGRGRATARDSNGRALRMVGTHQDITERKQMEDDLRKSEAVYHLLFEASQEGIAILDAETAKIIDANPSLQKLSGLSLEELRGKEIWEIESFNDIRRHIDFEKLRQKEFARIEPLPIKAKEKGSIDVELTSTVYEVSGKKVMQFNIRDITERKRMEEEIQSLARFPSENPNPVLRLDSHGTIITANESAKELLQSWSSAIGQVAPEYWCETVTDLLSSGESRDIDVEVNDRLLTFCAKPVVKAGYVNLYGRDITQRANLQKSLKESEEKYRAMVENSPNMIGIFQDGVLKYFNTSAIHALGWTHEEFASPSFDPIENVVAPKSRSLLKENIGKRLRGEEIAPYEISLTRKDGSEIPVEVRGARITYEGKPAVQFSFANVTERKHAEENRSYLAAIVESSDDAIIGKTLDGVITSWNRGAEKLYGYSAEEAKGKPITILIPPDHRDELPKILYQIRKGEHIQHFETQRMRKDGYVVQVSLAVSPIRDSMGEIIGASKIARDITQELLMRKELQETSEREKVEQTTRARLDFILSSSPAITFTGKPNADLTDFTITYMSSNVKQILGYDPDDYMVDPNFWVNHLHPEDSDLTRSQLRRVFTDGHVSVEYRFQCKEGTYQWMRDTVDLIKDRDGKPIEVVGASIEINEQKRIEEENTKLNSTLSLSLSEVIDRVEVFSRTREKLRTVPDVTSGLDIILDSMLWNFSLDFGAFIVLDRHENRANIRATKGKDKPIRLDDSYPLGSFVELQDLQTKSVTKVVREGEKSLFDASVVLIIPVLSGKELYGLLVFGKAEQFSVDENSMRILELYAEVVHSFIMERSITVLPTRERARFGRGVADLEPGNLYLVKKEPAKAFEIFVSSVFGNHEGLCITRMYPPTVRSKYGLEKTPIVWLTNEASESERTVQSVQDLSILIMDFLEKAKSSVILLDGLEYILTNSGFDTFIRLIQVLKDRLQRKGGVLVAPILEGAFGPKELALLQRESVTLTE